MSDLRDAFKKAGLLNDKDARRLQHEERVQKKESSLRNDDYTRSGLLEAEAAQGRRTAREKSFADRQTVIEVWKLR